MSESEGLQKLKEQLGLAEEYGFGEIWLRIPLKLARRVAKYLEEEITHQRAS